MAESDNTQETFEDFKKSFAYGSRTDLNFKFLKALSNEDAAQFFQELLWKLGDSFDDGQFQRIVDHVVQWQIKGYTAPGTWQYDDRPFTPLPKPVAELRLALFTSTGHFVAGDDPEPFGVKNMSQAEAARRIDDFIKAEPQLSAIPVGTPVSELRVRHGGYDVRGVQRDPNVAFPIQILRQLAQEKVIGWLAPQAYSFMGACSQLRLLNKSGPQWVKQLQAQEIEAALLVPV